VRDKLLDAEDISVELVKGHRGVFDVTVDGQLKFSKKKLKRFPTDEDLDAIVGHRPT